MRLRLATASSVSPRQQRAGGAHRQNIRTRRQTIAEAPPVPAPETQAEGKRSGERDVGIAVILIGICLGIWGWLAVFTPMLVTAVPALSPAEALYARGATCSHLGRNPVLHHLLHNGRQPAHGRRRPSTRNPSRDCQRQHDPRHGHYRMGQAQPRSERHVSLV